MFRQIGTILLLQRWMKEILTETDIENIEGWVEASG
jgi:hypothetical protein